MSKVFIIDDDPIHQRIVQIMVEKHKIFTEYKSFTDARLALADLSENAMDADALPDVILLDLNMPLMDGDF
ncbi:response regulator [Rubrolithibacter danxiaensis]|uniref:response regulator n=1 Tax=Rubrolithibacter danxiaensis TaxID=3390805 RepID=UPI003BF81F88